MDSHRWRTCGGVGLVLLFVGLAGLVSVIATVMPLTEFPMPPGPRVLGDIAAGPDGNLWFTEGGANKIGRITPAGVITEFPVPADTGPGIVAGPDGNLWFVEQNGNRIGRITPEGFVTEFPVPTSASAPSGIAAGPDGNLWFTELQGQNIGRITPAGVITEFPVPGPGVGPSHNRRSRRKHVVHQAIGQPDWPDHTGRHCHAVPGAAGQHRRHRRRPRWKRVVHEVGADNIGRITPAGVITEFPVPSVDSGPATIAAGPDGNMWFTEFLPLGNRIGRVHRPASSPSSRCRRSTAGPLASPPARWEHVVHRAERRQIRAHRPRSSPRSPCSALRRVSGSSEIRRGRRSS